MQPSRFDSRRRRAALGWATLWAMLVALGCAHSGRGAASWVDAAPHDVLRVRGEGGVGIELLDFHGAGPPVVLLAGLGDSAHVWDEWAPPLTAHFHVWALTRRGFGASDRPDAGYEVPTLAADVLAALDVAAPDGGAALVGHSIAGEEMSFLARERPERLAALVYLDAAYDRTTVAAAFADVEVPKEAQPALTDQDLASCEAYRRYTWRVLKLREPEAELRSQWAVAADGRLQRAAPNPAFRAIFAAVEPPRYADGKVPLLAVYAKAERPVDELPLYVELAAAAQQRVDAAFAVNARWTEQQRALLRRERPDAEVVEVLGGSHYLHLHDEHREATRRRVVDFLRAHLK